MPLDRLEQARVRDRERCLIGEGLDQPDVFLGERPPLHPGENDHADQMGFEHDRDAQHHSIRPRAGVLVLRVGEDVRDMNRFSQQSRTAGRRRPIDRVRMLPVVLDLLDPALVACAVEQPVFE